MYNNDNDRDTHTQGEGVDVCCHCDHHRCRLVYSVCSRHGYNHRHVCISVSLLPPALLPASMVCRRQYHHSRLCSRCRSHHRCCVRSSSPPLCVRVAVVVIIAIIVLCVCIALMAVTKTTRSVVALVMHVCHCRHRHHPVCCVHIVAIFVVATTLYRCCHLCVCTTDVTMMGGGWWCVSGLCWV